MVDLTTSHYSAGTATVAGGATVVTGQGTAWAGAVRPGDLFGTHVGLPIRILSVESSTSLTLAHPWPGAAQTAAAYEIQCTPYDVGYRKAIEDLVTGIAEGNLPLFAALVGAANKLPYFDSADSMALSDLTSFARTLLDDADGPTALATLGMSSFWRGRMGDADAAAARAGLQALTTGDYGLGGILPAMPSLGSGAADAGPQSSFQNFTGDTLNRPPGWNTVADVLIQLASQGGPNTRRAQMAFSTSEDRVAFRRKGFDQPWATWLEIWHSGNQPVVSLAEAQAGSSSSPRAWSPQRVAQAIASLAPAVPADVYRRSNILATVSQSGGLPTGGIIERGSNANGEYVRFADGTQICSKTIGSLSVSTTSSLGGFFRSDTFTTPYAASFSDGNTSVFGARLFPTASVYQIEFGNNNGSTSSASYRFWALASASSEQSGGFVLVAIGRWF